MNTSRIILIVEAGWNNPPKEILDRVFGYEAVVNQSGKTLAVGNSAMLSGDTDKIREWIKSVGGKVWTSRNPMAGMWKLETIP